MNNQPNMDLPTLDIDPSALPQLPHTIMLDAAHTCWVTIDKLPLPLSQEAQDKFEELFALHPAQRSRILMMNPNQNQYEEVDAHRFYQSYGATPELNPELKKASYMFGGFQKGSTNDHDDDHWNDNNNNKVAECNNIPLPAPFQPLFEHMTTRRPYNQCVVTWYENGRDMIPFHGDWDLGMPCDADIATVTLTRNHDKSIPSREFVIKPIGEYAACTAGWDVQALYRRVSVKTTHGSIIVMGGMTQKKFRHGVPRACGVTEPRISLSLRQFDVSTTTTTTGESGEMTTITEQQQQHTQLVQ